MRRSSLKEPDADKSKKKGVTKSKPWQLSKWRKARQKFLTGKSCEWCGSREKLVVHHPQARYSLSDEQYGSLEGAITLCKRCHFSLHRGLVLCKVCKSNYHRPNREKCLHCFKESLSPQKVWTLEYHPYQHPWCGKTFRIKGENWQEEAEPQMCCIEQCEPNSCEIASRNWDEVDYE